MEGVLEPLNHYGVPLFQCGCSVPTVMRHYYISYLLLSNKLSHNFLAKNNNHYLLMILWVGNLLSSVGIAPHCYT